MNLGKVFGLLLVFLVISFPAYATFEVKSVSVSLSGTAGPVGSPGLADIVRVTAAIKNHASAAAMCGYDLWETDSAGTDYNSAYDGQEVFRGGEQKTVHGYLTIAHDPAATYYFKALVGDAAVPYVAGRPIAGEIQHSKMVSISDAVLHRPRPVPFISVPVTSIRTLPRSLPRR